MTIPTEPLLGPEFLAKLEQLELVSRKMLLGRFKGDRLSKRKGTSVEFADHRHYAVGDDLRFLDWNLYARLDRLFIKLFQEEEDLRLHILLDNSGSMNFGTPTKLRYAKCVAAALGFVGLANLNRVSVGTVGARFDTGLPALRGRRSLWRLLSYLEQLETFGAGDLSAAVRAFALRAPSGGIVVLLSDLLDKGGFEEPLRYLLARQMEVYVIQILAREEVEPELVGDLRLVDAEDADVAEVTLSAALIQRYKRNLDAFRGAVNSFCMRRGIQFLSTTNQAPFDRLVLTYLRRRGLVR